MSFAGIDLGTTTSGISIPKEDKVVMVDISGKNIIPSCVLYPEDGTNTMFGEAARNHAMGRTNNAVFDVKRLIGRKINDPAIQDDIQHLPFKIIDNGSGDPIIELNRKDGSTFTVTPVDVSAALLKFIVSKGKVALGRDIDSVVITVPANFNQSQREATKIAGEMAGLHVLGIMNEPTAAAYAYGFENDIDRKRKILIYDFGGGTFDISIIEVGEDKINLIGSGGDVHLGGADIDILIADHFNSLYKAKTGIDLKENPNKMKKLIRKCEEAKIALSDAQTVDIEFDDLETAGVDVTLARASLFKICGKLFQRTIEMVKTTLSSVNLTTENITDVVLIGGSSKIPAIQDMLKDLFTKSKINKNINADEAVAMGAGLYAQQLYLENHHHETVDNHDGRGKKVLVTQNNGKKVLIPQGRKVLVQEKVNISIGIEGINPANRHKPLMKKIVVKNSPINKEFEDYFMSLPNTTNAIITVYEGESDYAKENHKVHEYNFSGFPSNRDGTIIRINCRFHATTSLLIIEGDADGVKCRTEVNVAGRISHS